MFKKLLGIAALLLGSTMTALATPTAVTLPSGFTFVEYSGSATVGLGLLPATFLDWAMRSVELFK